MDLKRKGQYIEKNKERALKDTLCWKCKNAVPNIKRGTGCNWSREFKAVEGWKVHEVIQYENCKSKENRDSYIVLICPEFEVG